MTAPVEQDVEPVQVDEDQADTGEGPEADEMRVNFPLLAIEGYDTADGRFITVGALTARALPLTLLGQTRSSHGGEKEPAAHTIGRIDHLERVPGPQVVSKVTGEPFPEGTFVWRGSGVVNTSKMIDDDNVSDLIRRRYLRGLSADLVPSDFELYGEHALAEDSPTRKAAVHKADLGGATVIPIPAFGDCCVEVADEAGADVAPDPAELGLVASAFPAWRSAEVGDYPALAAAAIPDGSMTLVRWPANAADVIAEWIAEGEGEPRDAEALARHIADQVQANWAPDVQDDPDDELAAPIVAAADSAFAGHDLIFYKNRSTPKVVSRGAKAPAVPDSYGPVVSRRKATAEEEKTIARGDWVRVDSSGKQSGESGYDKSKVRPNLSAELAEPVGEPDPDGMGIPDAPQPCGATGTDTYESETGEHPATRSLLFDNSERYVATCEEHEDAARAEIEARGSTVDQVVEIPDEEHQPDDDQPASTEENVR